MTKDTFYFTHDYNSRSDEKIKSLVRKHGMLGYGVFWAIVEDLYNNANAMRTDTEGIAYEYRVDEKMVKSILNDFDLFIFDNDNFGSLSVQRRLEERNNKSIKARESAFKRWNKDLKDMPTHCERIENKCECNAIKERKGKKRKESILIYNKDLIYSFDEFWNDYDKKASRDKCKIKFERLNEEERLLIKEHIPKYKDSQPDKKFRKNPETYLNNKSWNDEIIINNNGKQNRITTEDIGAIVTAGKALADARESR